MLPFSLQLAKDGSWRGRWAEAKLFIVVGGSENAADPESLVTLTDVVERWAEVREQVATYLATLVDDEHIPLDPRSIGGFAARNCGFDQELGFSSLSVPDPSRPDRVELTFDTGYPDGYAMYRIVLQAGQPTTVTAFAT